MWLTLLVLLHATTHIHIFIYINVWGEAVQSCGFCLSLVVVFLAPPLLIDPACVQIFGFILLDVRMPSDSIGMLVWF